LSHRLCPVRAFASFLVTRGSGTGPLFIFESGAALTRGFLVNMLRQWFPTAHGVSSFVIQTLGRWHSNTFLTYIDITDGTVGNEFARVVGLDDVTDETPKR
jgi:hypothetical protein